MDRLQISKTLLKQLMRRKAIVDYCQAITEQTSPFEHDEKLVLMGSSQPMVESIAHTEATPRWRIPSDIDLALFEPQGEKGGPDEVPGKRYPAKKQTIKKCTTVLEGAAKSLQSSLTLSWGIDHADQGEFDSEQTARKRFDAKIGMTQRDIEQFIELPETQALLGSIFAKPNTHFTGDIAHQAFAELVQEQRTKPNASPIYKDGEPAASVDLQIEMIGYPFSFLPPKKLEGLKPSASGNTQLMGDDYHNTLALKLVRLFAEGGRRTNSLGANHLGEPEDLIDIYDITNMMEAQGQKIDMDLLALLVVEHCSYQKRKILVGTPGKLVYNDENVRLIKEDMDALLSRSGNLGVGLRMTETQVRNMLQRADGLMKGCMARISPDQPEVGALGDIAPLRDIFDDVHERNPLAAAQNLTAHYGGLLGKVSDLHPNLAQQFTQNWNVRPRNM